MFVCQKCKRALKVETSGGVYDTTYELFDTNYTSDSNTKTRDKLTVNALAESFVVLPNQRIPNNNQATINANNPNAGNINSNLNIPAKSNVPRAASSTNLDKQITVLTNIFE